MLEIRIEAFPRLDSLGRRLRVATERKTVEVTHIVYAKVLENLSGKILQKKTGELYSSIRQQVDITSDLIVGEVMVDPTTPKALALEYGGKSEYVIEPVKSTILKFFWEKKNETVYLHSVNHPPSKEFAYMRLAAEETMALIPDKYLEAMNTVIAGGE